MSLGDVRGSVALAEKSVRSLHVLLARAYPNERAARALLRREARELAATGISLPGNAAETRDL